MCSKRDRDIRLRRGQLQQSQISNGQRSHGLCPQSEHFSGRVVRRNLHTRHRLLQRGRRQRSQHDGAGRRHLLGPAYSQFAISSTCNVWRCCAGRRARSMAATPSAAHQCHLSCAPPIFVAESALTRGQFWLVQNQDSASGALIRRHAQREYRRRLHPHDPISTISFRVARAVFTPTMAACASSCATDPPHFIDATMRLDYSLADQLDNVYSKLLAPFDPVTNSILGITIRSLLGGYPNPPNAEVTRQLRNRGGH